MANTQQGCNTDNQQLSLVGNNLTISKGNTITLPISQATWGVIQGTLANQTDLNTALNARATLSGNNVFTGSNSFFGSQTSFRTKYITHYNNEGLYFQTSSLGVSMFIHDNGNVLIGTTTNTGEKFQVNGASRFNGALNVTGQGQNAINLDGVTILGSFSTTHRIYGRNGLQIFNVSGGNTRAILTSTGEWCFGFTTANGGTVNPVPSAIFQIDSDSKGFLIPRMTTTQINTIVSPADGLMVYNTELKTVCFYDAGGVVWKRVSHSNM